MIKAILFIIVLSLSFVCFGQNIYDSRTTYYNMDTIRCVDRDIRFWEDDKITSYSGNPDSTSLYCIFKEKIEIPIVTVNDDNIFQIIDSCLIDATESNYLQFPDTSGCFVNIYISKTKADHSRVCMSVTPFSNYYMAEVLLGYRENTFYDWYGYKERVLHGCFFRDDILCVITSSGRLNNNIASCLFLKTESKMTLMLFSPIVTAVTDQTESVFYYYHDCNTETSGVGEK